MKKSTLNILLMIVALSVSGQYHHQLHRNNAHLANLPMGYNDYFAGSGECVFCHNSQTDPDGNLVAIVEDWRSTMMANAARDPFWRAKVSHEVLVNPQLKNEIETVCTRCHAPLGNLNAIYGGQSHYLMSDMKEDSLALDGVSCTVCHQIPTESLGSFSGTFSIGTNKEIYGPYTDPFPNPMIMNTGYTPVYGEHIRDSRVCGSCHTLLTSSLDMNGQPTGETFVEQAVYHEWLNSAYAVEGTECYVCHVPEINGPVKISHVPPWLDGRTPYGKHHFAGANVFMLKMLRNNIQTLSLTADIQHFDSSIQRTYDNLQLRTLNLSLTEVNRTDDSLYIDVKIENMAGHKLPSAYPSRRVFVELIGVADSGDTLFHSGKMDHNFNIIDEDPDYEPHHNIIDMQEKVQIYEMVMANVNGDVTTVLERAYEHLKDNRIPPLGFQIAHQSYDTIQIIGHAIMDDDFNAIDGEEGNGADVIHYQMGVDQSIEDISITTNVYYQTVSLKWLQQMFEYSSSDIDLFKSLYETSDRAPVLLAQSVITSQAVAVDEEESLPEFSLYPNPSKGSFTIIHTQDIHEIQVVSTYGKVIYTHRSEQNPIRRLTIDLEVENGLYFIVSTNPTGRQVRKLIIS